eukprot:7784606-Pyramimonas_sp.AAC.1
MGDGTSPRFPVMLASPGVTSSDMQCRTGWLPLSFPTGRLIGRRRSDPQPRWGRAAQQMAGRSIDG